MKVSVITITNNRPEALALNRIWLERQTYDGALEHIVEEGRPLGPNMLAALPRVSGDVVVFMEDDDYYAPGWIEWCVEALETASRVGQRGIRYYHLPSGAHHSVGPKNKIYHTALGASALRRSELWRVEKSIRSGGRWCKDVWLPKGDLSGKVFEEKEHRYVAMKGLPGTPGKSKHSADAPCYKNTPNDPKRQTLEKWCGKEASAL
jgi:glycosyltransferase involved in cell wall biosynthesis